MADKDAIHSMENHFDPMMRAMGKFFPESFLASRTDREQPATHCTGHAHPQYQRPRKKPLLIPKSRTGNQNRSILKKTSTASVIEAVIRTTQRKVFLFGRAIARSDFNMV
jgi:hypothetical protein